MGEVATSGLKQFNAFITNERTQSYIATVLKDRAGSFMNNMVAIVANNAKLQECEPGTLLYAGMKSTALNLPLDPSLGMAYVIPFKNNKAGITEAQFQIGTKGFKQLALRSGQFQCINVTDVREGEIKRRNRLSGEIEFKFEEEDEKRSQLKVVGYVSYFRLLNGFESTLYMTVEELKEHGLRYSQTYKSSNSYVKNNSKWSTDFGDMCMKGLALDTIIPTPSGSTTMGEIKVGDKVFNALGEITSVIAKSEVKNIDCYEIQFQNGQTFISDFEHRWFAKGAGMKKDNWDVFTTEELYIAKKLGLSVVIPSNPSIEFSEKELPIEPYLLGYWLGNGNNKSAQMTCCTDDADELISYMEEYSVSTRKDPRNNSCTLNVSSLTGKRLDDSSLIQKLRDNNLLSNKHIPDIYKRSSRFQREELIRGMCDSDGSIDNTRGRCSYCSIKEELVLGVYEILCTLGERCIIRSGISRGFGRDCLFYQVEWKPKTFNPFKLKRKASRYRNPIFSDIGTSIKSIKKVESVPTQCLAVDSGDATDEVDFRKSFLIGEGFYPTHNTVLKLNLSRNAPLSVEMQDAVIADQAVIRETGMEYVENTPEPVIDEDKAKKVAEMFGEAPTDAIISEGGYIQINP